MGSSNDVGVFVGYTGVGDSPLLWGPVREHGRTRCPIRFSRILLKASYVNSIPPPAPVLSFAPLPQATHADTERLYGEHKLLA